MAPAMALVRHHIDELAALPEGRALETHFNEVCWSRLAFWMRFRSSGFLLAGRHLGNGGQLARRPAWLCRAGAGLFRLAAARAREQTFPALRLRLLVAQMPGPSGLFQASAVTPTSGPSTSC